MQTKVEICGVNTSGLPVLSAKKTDELLKKSAAGDKQARDELIRGNLRLVLSVVQRFQGRGESTTLIPNSACASPPTPYR